MPFILNKYTENYYNKDLLNSWSIKLDLDKLYKPEIKRKNTLSTVR